MSQEMAASSTTSLKALGLEPASPSTPVQTFGHPRGRYGPRKLFWTETWQEVRADLRAAQWRRGFLWCLFLIWVAGLLALLIMLPLYTLLSGLTGSSACQPDGSFSPYTFGYSFWNFSGFFQITLGFGSFTFTEAKVIDVFWDIIVGRVGQAVLAIFSWKAFSTYVRSKMDKAPVTYDTYWNIFMRDEASFRSTARMIRDFATRRGLRSAIAMAFMVLTMIYVLVFPTLASAMTGYSPNNAAFVLDKQGNLLPFQSFVPVAYIIHDGWRVNLTGNAPIAFRDNYYPANSDPTMYAPETISETFYCPYYFGDSDCYFVKNVSSYVQNYGFFGLNQAGQVNNIETLWQNKTSIPAPALNITSYFIPQHNTLYGFEWTDPRTGLGPFRNASELAYYQADANDTFSMSYVQRSGTCQPRGDYRWGFSFIQLYISIAILFVWTMEIWILWTKGHCALAHWSDREVPGKYKALLDLSATINKDFAVIGEDPAMLSNKQLMIRIDGRLRGGTIEARMPFPVPPFSLRKSFWAWIKKEKWWFGITVLLTLIVLTCWLGLFIVPYVYFALLIWTTTAIFAMAVGRTTRSRLALSSIGIVSGCVVILFTAKRGRW